MARARFSAKNAKALISIVNNGSQIKLFSMLTKQNQIIDEFFCHM